MFSVSSKICALFRDKDGVVAVEAALLFPFLAVLGFGAMDASNMLLQNHKMKQSLVSAANYMARSTDPELVETQAKQIAVSGTTDPAAEPLIKNWTPEDVSISYKLIPNDAGQYRGGNNIRVVDITTTLPYEGFGILKSIRGRTITLNAQYQQRMTGTAK